MKYYYLVNGKLMWALSKMPTMSNFSSNEFGKNDYHDAKRNWLNSLQTCSIKDVELEKVKDAIVNERFGGQYSIKTSVMFSGESIEVTDIIEEKIKLSSMGTGKINYLVFKQPKSESNSSLDNTLQWCLNYINKQKDSDEKTALIKELNTKSEANEAVELIKYLDECIEACNIKIKEFGDAQMSYSVCSSEAMKQAYINVKNELFKTRDNK